MSLMPDPLIYKKRVMPLEIGAFYGKWEVLEYLGERSCRNSYWKCRCACGTIQDLVSTSLRTGRSKQCKKCATKTNGRIGIDRQAKKHLYIIYTKDYFKIGSSDNPDRRIRDLAVSCPYDIKTFIVKENMGHLETILHALFMEHHHKGEWFKINGACEIV